MPATVERGCLVIADISGYTDYVVASPLEYAEDVVADVTATVVTALEPVVRVNKLEGDAAFGYVLDGAADASMLLDTIEECYFAFRARLRGIEHATSCGCAACTGVTDLNLKFIVHYGSFIRRPGTRGEELTGRDVILVHRLLKNAVPESLGITAYALFTEACVRALGLSPSALGMVEHGEEHPDVGKVRTHVLDLEGRWQTERDKRRVYVGAAEAAFAVDVRLPGPPEIVWEYLTSPQKRLLWQFDEMEEVDSAGRRSTGTSSVCVDGRARIYEEILDWRPFRYFTERATLSGSLRLILTTELEPDGDGTRVVTRARPERGRRLGWLPFARAFRRRLDDRYARLSRLLPPRLPGESRLPLVPS